MTDERFKEDTLGDPIEVGDFNEDDVDDDTELSLAKG